jgi:hypothetical protein
MAAPATPELRRNYDGMPVTREVYLDLPHDGNKYDMIDGVLYTAPSATSEHGVKEYFIIDPEEKAIHLWINRGSHWEKFSGDEIRSELLKGFSLRYADFFV